MKSVAPNSVPCIIKATGQSGVIVETRVLMDEATSSSSSSLVATSYGFVRLQQQQVSGRSASSSMDQATMMDARQDRWVPLTDLDVSNINNASHNPTVLEVWDPTLREATKEMVAERLRCGPASLDFLEARLRRDIRIPPNVRSMKYLETTSSHCGT